MDFDDVFIVVNDKKKQVLSSQILKDGTIPVVDQGKGFIAGYSNSKEFHTNIPVIVFGDHTLVLKYINFPFVVGADGVQLIKNKNDNFDLKYLYYLLEKKIQGIPVVSYSRHFKFLKELSFDIPESIEEQKNIANILSNVDKNIENVMAEISRMIQLKSGFLEQVVNRHLKIGLVPLEDYCDVVTDGTHDSPINVPKNKDHIIPFVTSKNLLGSEGLDLNNITYITLKDHELIKKRSGVGRNTLLIGMIGTIGEPTLVDTDKEISVKNVAIIKNKDIIKQKWIYYLLGSEFFNKYIKESQAGGVLKFLSLSLVRGFNVPDVQSDDLVKDVKALDLFEANIKNKKEELEKLQQLKKGLLNKLL